MGEFRADSDQWLNFDTDEVYGVGSSRGKTLKVLLAVVALGALAVWLRGRAAAKRHDAAYEVTDVVGLSDLPVGSGAEPEEMAAVVLPEPVRIEAPAAIGPVQSRKDRRGVRTPAGIGLLTAAVIAVAVGGAFAYDGISGDGKKNSDSVNVVDTGATGVPVPPPMAPFLPGGASASSAPSTGKSGAPSATRSSSSSSRTSQNPGGRSSSGTGRSGSPASSGTESGTDSFR
jgi:uncharacterized membrane protein YgcG